MQYTKAGLGRLFIVKLDHKEAFIPALKSLLKSEQVSHGVLFFMGALNEGRMVTGPVKPVLPPVPNWTAFKDGWEVFGMATIVPGEDGPAIHIHGAAGRDQNTLVGCLRDQAQVFLTIEAVLYELTGIEVKKLHDKTTGVSVLNFNA